MPKGIYPKSKEHALKIGKANKGRNNGNWKGGKWANNKQEYFKDYWQRYRILHEAKVKHNSKLQRDRRYTAPGSHTEWEWEVLKRQFGNTCPCCRKSEPEITLTRDHIRPLSQGGSNYIENIQPLCLSCNQRKHTKTINYGGQNPLKND